MAPSATCSGCGAPLWLPGAATTVRCTFCGRTQVVGAAPFAAPGSPPVAPGPARPSRVATFVIAFVLFDLLLGVVIAVVVLVGRAGPARSFGRPSTGPGSGGVVPPGERLQWHASGHTVAPADVDGDGVEDVVGVYRLLELPSGTQTLYAGAFRGTTFERVWKTGPLGSLDGASGTHVAVAGRRALVTEARGIAHVLDVATGREVSAVKLTDQARGLCVPRGGAARVFVQVADGANVLVDLDTGSATRALAPPAGCAARAQRECRSIHGACVEADHMPIGGVLPRAVLVERGNGVVLGMRTPGTPTPMALGFDPATKAVRWTQPVVAQATSPSTDAPGDLLDGTLVTAGAEGTLAPWHLVAIDAASGARRWTAVVPRSGEGSGPESIVLTPTRVYVPHWTWLEVHDARDGRHLGTIGMW